jgi:hypothetical protein
MEGTLSTRVDFSGAAVNISTLTTISLFSTVCFSSQGVLGEEGVCFLVYTPHWFCNVGGEQYSLHHRSAIAQSCVSLIALHYTCFKGSM